MAANKPTVKRWNRSRRAASPQKSHVARAGDGTVRRDEGGIHTIGEPEERRIQNKRDKNSVNVDKAYVDLFLPGNERRLDGKQHVYCSHKLLCLLNRCGSKNSHVRCQRDVRNNFFVRKPVSLEIARLSGGMHRLQIELQPVTRIAVGETDSSSGCSRRPEHVARRVGPLPLSDHCLAVQLANATLAVATRLMVAWRFHGELRSTSCFPSSTAAELCKL